ncbi:hypothetical protein FACS189455_1350 [Bacteroidia bacterium]|nr:hypothetical protein FACS189455_1350 [Bacteroidia bacterium]
MIVFSCVEENDLIRGGDEQLSEEVSATRSWYEHHMGEKNLQLKSFGVNNKRKKVKPNWGKSVVNENANYKITETDLGDEEEKFGFASPECMQMYDQTKDKRYLTCNIRLIVRTNKKTNKTDGFIMVVYPDVSYMKNNKDLKKISYLNRDKKFSGVIYYHNMEGNFVKGWLYVEGSAYIIEPSNEKNIDGFELRQTVECIAIYQDTYRYTEWYVNGHYSHTTFDGIMATDVLGVYCGGGGNGDGNYQC